MSHDEDEEVEPSFKASSIDDEEPLEMDDIPLELGDENEDDSFDKDR